MHLIYPDHITVLRPNATLQTACLRKYCICFKMLCQSFKIMARMHTRCPDLPNTQHLYLTTFPSPSPSSSLFSHVRTANRSCRHPWLSIQDARSAMDPRTGRRISARLYLQGSTAGRIPSDLAYSLYAPLCIMRGVDRHLELGCCCVCSWIVGGRHMDATTAGWCFSRRHTNVASVCCV